MNAKGSGASDTIGAFERIVGSASQLPGPAISPEYLSRLRKGYNSVRHAAEFRTSRGDADAWLCRIWGEITLAGAGLAFGVLSIIPSDNGLDRTTKIRLATELLSQMHFLERLVPDAASGWRLSPQTTEMSIGILRLFELFNAVWKGRNTSKNPFKLRSWLLERAKSFHGRQ
jgi:hypothetical protein